MEEGKQRPITGPDSKTLEALRGKISEPKRVASQRPGAQGQEVTVRVVEEGAGMVGLEDREDNKEWSGIFNHLVKTARIATFLAEELKKRGEGVNLQLVLNSILVSHSGRRAWDEAKWYPDVVDNPQEKAVPMGDHLLARKILKEARFSGEIMDVVDAHAIGTLYPIERMDTWEKKIALYTDMRVSQNVMSLEERIRDHAERAEVSGRVTQEQLDGIADLVRKIEREIFLRISISPDDITDDFPPQPRWEKYMRRLYVSDAEKGIFNRISFLMDGILRGEEGSKEELDREFPLNTWWGRYVRELYAARKGQPFHPRVGKQLGIARAIEFYRGIESSS